jgi:RNA polymerase sigma-70 factor, ECF subfamily
VAGGVDCLFTRLTSPSQVERDAAISELRGFLVRAVTRSFTGRLSAGDVDDIVQESLLRVHSRLGTFAHQSRFSTWACAIAVNCAISELRRRKHHHVSLADAAAQSSAALVQEAELATGAEEIELARLRRGIAEALTERQREATLAKLGGMPLVEIARRLGTSQGAIYKLLHDARLRLKHYLDAREHTTEDIPVRVGSQ